MFENIVKIFAGICLMLLFMSCSATQPLDTVPELDIERYMGTWYEIARLPNSFEKDLSCTTANYSLLENGKVQVINRGYSALKDEYKEAKGKAWLPNTSIPGQLKVSFFWPFAGDYFVISLDSEYQHVLVGSPSRKYLWILARNRTLDDSIYSGLLELAQSKGFAVDQLERISQNCP